MTINQSNKLYERAQKLLGEKQWRELFHLTILRPLEVCLKTSERSQDHIKVKIVDSQSEEKQADDIIKKKDGGSKKGKLPFGLKNAFKQNISQNKYSLKDFNPINKDHSYSQIVQSDSNNLISMLKSNQEIQIAICVCMYTEDKMMLKKTLCGIQKNILKFVQQGIHYNKIAVVVVMDGIQKADNTMDSYFEELQKQNNIDLNNLEVDQGIYQEVKAQIQLQKSLQDEDISFINIFFQKAELEKFRLRNFSERRAEYLNIKRTQIYIEELEIKNSIAFQSLNNIIEPFFFEEARKEWRKEFGTDFHELSNVTEDQLKKRYVDKGLKTTVIIKQALNQAKIYCNEYFQTRKNLCLLSSFRVNIEESEMQQKQKNQIGQQKNSPKMNLFFLTKYFNKGKLSSHHWFFNGFCQQLKPKYSFLLDVGLEPEGQSLWKMYQKMKSQQKLGGVCGFMRVRYQKLQKDQQNESDFTGPIGYVFSKIFSIQRAQQFQYNISHIMNKSFESSSCFQFIHVLPGAFSGYKMEALIKQYGEVDESPQILLKYFQTIQGLTNPIDYQNYHLSFYQGLRKVLLPDFLNCSKIPEDSWEQYLYDSNVYLAEDRILCLGIKKNGFSLAFLPDSFSMVDSVKTLSSLMGQRKRWINGSYFAFEKVNKEHIQVHKNINCFQKKLLTLQMKFLSLITKLAFIGPALFIYAVHSSMVMLFEQQAIKKVVHSIDILKENEASSKLPIFLVDFIHLITFVQLVIYFVNTNIQAKETKGFVYKISTFYSILSFFVIGFLLYDLINFIKNESPSNFMGSVTIEQPATKTTLQILRFMMISIFGLYGFITLLFSILFCSFQTIYETFFGMLSYIFYSSTYMTILNVYALCRIDDISWGTKGLNTDTSPREVEMMSKWRSLKLMHVSKFMVYNLGIIFILFSCEEALNSLLIFYITFFFVGLLFLITIVTFLFAVLYLIKYKLGTLCCSKSKQKENQSMANNSMRYQQESDDHILKYFQKIKDQVDQSIKNKFMEIYIRHEKLLNYGQGTETIQIILMNYLKKKRPQEDIRGKKLLIQPPRFQRVQIRYEIPPPKQKIIKDDNGIL